MIAKHFVICAFIKTIFSYQFIQFIIEIQYISSHNIIKMHIQWDPIYPDPKNPENLV